MAGDPMMSVMLSATAALAHPIDLGAWRLHVTFALRMMKIEHMDKLEKARVNGSYCR